MLPYVTGGPNLGPLRINKLGVRVPPGAQAKVVSYSRKFTTFAFLMSLRNFPKGVLAPVLLICPPLST